MTQHSDSSRRGRRRARIGGAFPAALVSVAALAVASPAALEAEPPGACALLESRQVGAVQDRPVVEAIESSQPGSAVEVRQCVYRTEDLTSSVSLTLTVSRGEVGDGALRYWRSRFHPEGGHTGKEDPPRPVPGIGDEAYWAGDPVAGSLYVLAGDRFLRISVGGVRDPAEREARAARLAALALDRLDGS